MISLDCMVGHCGQFPNSCLRAKGIFLHFSNCLLHIVLSEVTTKSNKNCSTLSFWGVVAGLYDIRLSLQGSGLDLLLIDAALDDGVDDACHSDCRGTIASIKNRPIVCALDGSVRLFFYISWTYEQLYAFQHLCHPLTGNRTNSLNKISLIHSENLGDIDDTLFCQIRLALVEHYIARRMRPLEVRGQGAYYNRVDAASIEHIILNNQMRMTVSRFRTRWLAQINPEYITLFDYQRSFNNRRYPDFICTLIFSSSISGESLYAAFIACNNLWFL